MMTYQLDEMLEMIECIDAQIISLLLERYQLSRALRGMQLNQPSVTNLRDQKVERFLRLEHANTGPLSDYAIARLFTCVFSLSEEENAATTFSP